MLSTVPSAKDVGVNILGPAGPIGLWQLLLSEEAEGKQTDKIYKHTGMAVPSADLLMKTDRFGPQTFSLLIQGLEGQMCSINGGHCGCIFFFNIWVHFNAR